MFHFRRKVLMFFLKGSDVVFFIASTMLAFIHSGKFPNLSNFIYTKLSIGDFLLFCCLLVMWSKLCEFYNLYRSKRLDSFSREARDVAKVVLTAVLVIALAGVMFNRPYLRLGNVLVFAGYAGGLTLVFRFFLRISLRQLRLRGHNLRSALVVGTNKTAYSWAENIENSPELGIKIFGFVDTEIIEKNDKWPFLGKIEELAAILKENVIDEVVIAMPIRSNYSMIQRVILFSEEQGIPIRYAFPLFDTKNIKTKINNFETSEEDEFMIEQSSYNALQYFTKRVLDVFLAGLMLLFLSPLLLLVALLIKLTSEGPVFFVQTRLGFNKRLFGCYKFRTMVNNAEKLQMELEEDNEMDGAAFKMKEDPRITPIGKFLRKTSIDELPQLFNVIKGDISLVGPRPLPVRDYKKFDKTWQCRRLSVLPGITCIWQISGRNNISFEKWMQLDMNYIDNWNILLDLKILFKTIPAVLKGHGAS